MLKTLSVYLDVHSHKNCIVCPKIWDSAAVHYKVQYSPYFTSIRIIRTSITLPGTVLYTWHIRTRYQVPGKIYVVYGTWHFTGIYLPSFSSLCSFFRVRTEPYPRGIYPGYCPTKNFCKFCRTFIPVPGNSVSSVRHSYMYVPGTSVSFCKIPIPLPGTSVSSIGLAQYPGYGCTFVAIPGEPGILSGLTRRMDYALRRHMYVSSVTHTERQTTRTSIKIQ